jgi:hypothetical protein
MAIPCCVASFALVGRKIGCRLQHSPVVSARDIERFEHPVGKGKQPRDNCFFVTSRLLTLPGERHTNRSKSPDRGTSCWRSAQAQQIHRPCALRNAIEPRCLSASRRGASCTSVRKSPRFVPRNHRLPGSTSCAPTQSPRLPRAGVERRRDCVSLARRTHELRSEYHFPAKRRDACGTHTPSAA